MNRVVRTIKTRAGGKSVLSRSVGRRLLGPSLAAVAAMCASQDGHFVPRATAQNIALEEIVVTARKVEENLMTVPLAITAITANDIENRGIKQIEDVSLFTPSFHFIPQTGGGSGRNDRSSRLLTFRGMSIAGGILFIDGAAVSGNTPPPIADVERVEVLPGPQSAYFGRSTFMGALNYVMREPGTKFSGRVHGEVGSYGSNEAGLAVEGPLFGDKLAARLSLQHTYTGGQYENAADRTQKFGEQQTRSVSATVVAHPTDNLSVKLWGNFYEDSDGPPAQMSLKTGELNCNVGGTRGRYWCGEYPSFGEINKNLVSGNYDMTPYMFQELIGNRLGFFTAFDPHSSTHGGIRRLGWQEDDKIEYKTNGGYLFTVATSGHWSKTQTILDLVFRDGRTLRNPYFGAVCPTCSLAALSYPTWFLLSQGVNKDFNQEVRVTSPQDQRLRWVVGGNYLWQWSISDLYGVKVNGTASSGTPAVAHPNTKAVFGGAYYDIVPDLTLTAEARYQWDNVKNDVIGASTGFLLPTPQFFDATFKSFSPRAILDYKFSKDSTVYALYARGYRPGGFNSALTTQPASVLAQIATSGVGPTFAQEKIDNFEVGVKSTFWDGRARTTLALYKANWRNGQISTSVPFTTTTGQLNLITVTANLGAVDLKGAEFEGSVQVTRELRLSATMSYNDSDVKVYTCGDCLSIYGNTNAVGHKLGQAEKWKGSVSADYRDHLAGDYEWFAGADFSYRGKYFLDVSNLAWTKPRKIVNARVGVSTDKLQITAFVKNLFQDDALTGYLGLDILTQTPTNTNLQNEIRTALPDKRTFGIRANYNF